jgi:hypothetical protein
MLEAMTMLKTIVVLFAFLLFCLVFSGGAACLLLPIGNFRSPEEKTVATLLPMSDTEPGQYVSYHPTISFGNGQFQLQESDYFFTGPYMCRLGRIVATHSNNTATSVGYIPFLGVLLWDREWYFNMTQFALVPIVLFGGTIILLFVLRK